MHLRRYQVWKAALCASLCGSRNSADLDFRWAFKWDLSDSVRSLSSKLHRLGSSLKGLGFWWDLLQCLVMWRWENEKANFERSDFHKIGQHLVFFLKIIKVISMPFHCLFFCQIYLMEHASRLLTVPANSGGPPLVPDCQSVLMTCTSNMNSPLQ